MTAITIQTTVTAPIAKVWECWTKPEHITHWAFASDDWEAPSAQNDVRTGGKFTTRMQAKDGSAGFDFGGTYTNIIPLEQITYTIDDGRNVSVQFERIGEAVHITQTFEAEQTNPAEMQRDGWQAFLDNFKKYVENQ